MVNAHARRTLGPFFERVGWQARAGEPVNDTLLRGELIGALAVLGDEDIIAEVRRRAREPAALPADIRNAVLGAYAHNANEQDYADLLARARAAQDFVEQRRLWRWLASVKDESRARRTLQMTLGEQIPRQLRTQVIANVAGEHPRMAWNFVRTNRAQVEALLDPLQRLEFPTGIAAASSDPAMVGELQAYARDFPPGAERTVAGATATIMLRAQTIAERMPAVEAWIAARNAPTPRR
mgnify:CR=1 FL=1